MRKLFFYLALFVGAVSATLQAAVENPPELTALLNRIGGNGTASRFHLVVDESLSAEKDVFILTASPDGKPCVKGNTVLSVATGINWYLNHHAHVNLAWNNLTTDLSAVALPVPAAEERHTCSVDYRYYLNYCTFSYSMSTWTWERWQQEIDWMALHGINMPLQIVGLDVVWKKLLVEDLGYSRADANKFIAGPCFQAWWGMNNLEGWGGPNPEWWYERQEVLARNILARMRELGMQPVLPGYAGMVPSDIGTKGYKALNQGGWCGFVRPYILDPNSSDFADISAKYYKRLKEVMGESAYYSMDPFHEGANTAGIDVPAAYEKIAGAMTAAQPDAKWVIQFWQWSGAQYNVLDKVPLGKLIVLDLFSDAHTHFGSYKGHDAVYCMLHNFGGRTGFYGRLNGVIEGFFSQKSQHGNIKGIGATPEAIETVPVLYDALFELPWYASRPDAKAWLADYTVARYGTDNADIKAAWEKLRNSSLNCTSTLQGPMEAVVCARPALTVNAVSSWGGTGIFYDSQDVIDAAHLLLKNPQAGENYSYDLTDLSRQALTDYAYYLLRAIQTAHASNNQTAFAARRDAYLQLLLDLDKLLQTNRNFMLGRWTNMARGIADEVAGTTPADKNWLEQNNARRLITTWGDKAQANGGGLRDYSYREWAGMMKDFYYPRWRYFFDNNLQGTDWFEMEDKWVKNGALQYDDHPVGRTEDVAGELFAAYFLPLEQNDGTRYYVFRKMEQDKRADITYPVYRGETFTLPVTVPSGETARLSVDFNNDGTYAADETVDGPTVRIPEDAATGAVNARLSLADGTVFVFGLIQMDRITEARTVSVSTVDAAQGTATIEGADGNSLTGTDPVTLTAQPAAGYDFLNWTDTAGKSVSTANPYIYYGKEAAAFTAHFVQNKWGVPQEDLRDLQTVISYEQYVATMSVAQNGLAPVEIYRATSCPEHYFHTTAVVDAPAGCGLTLSWKDTETANGLSYCRLSAYIDLNGDGDFDDAGEFLAVVGGKNTAGNTMLSDGSLQVLLPYDMPLGVTHIRLRFDGSYSEGWDAVTDAKPANAEMLRHVYDVLLNVTERAAADCRIEVVSSNAAGGSVDANGNENPYVAGTNETVILRAYPAEGYELKGWKDPHGRMMPRSLMDGNAITFKPVESGTYTAVFGKVLPETITLNGWEFRYTEQDDQLTLTEAVRGSGALTLPEAYVYDGISYPLVALAPGFLNGNEEVTTVSLPASLTDLGIGGTVFCNELAWNGEDGQHRVVTLETPMSAAEDWTMRAHFTSDGSSYNQWGSGLLATGDNALANSYTGGFQFYLSADGLLKLKFNSSSETNFTLRPGASFEVVVIHAADGATSVTLSTADGKSETRNFTGGLQSIGLLSSAVPAGVNVTGLHFEQEQGGGTSCLFKGCKNLSAIKVDKNNPRYSANLSVLYDREKQTLLRCPEGLDMRNYTLPKTVERIAAEAFYGVSKLERLVATGAVSLTRVEADAFTGTGVVMQVTAEQCEALSAAGDFPLLVSAANNRTVDAGKVGGALVLEICATPVRSGAFTAAVPGVACWYTYEFEAGKAAALCFPADVRYIATTDGMKRKQWAPAEAFTFLRFGNGKFVEVDASAWDVIPAGLYMLMPKAGAVAGKTVTFQMDAPGDSPAAVNGWAGNATVAVAAPSHAYTYVPKEGCFLPAASVAPLAAYRVSDGGEDFLPFVIDDTPTGIGSPAVAADDRLVTVYSVSGTVVRAGVRRGDALRHLPKGVYVIEGQKVVCE